MKTMEVVEKDSETKKFAKIEGVNMQSLHDYMVLVYNNDSTDGQSVVDVLMDVCGYSAEQAIHYTMKIHHSGKAVVFWGNKKSCEELSVELAKILVKSEVLKNE